ncbi:hypothetical protein TIFTF001_028880 [Ficus carica]|uniref:Uncharacterized protein n=1 Tax=Ficus carica TaxID=3494 RepID=A0AA88J0N8_FICCA|nr:hypothetical protein TIFTF001_028880 [Ficus carica]
MLLPCHSSQIAGLGVGILPEVSIVSIYPCVIPVEADSACSSSLFSVKEVWCFLFSFRSSVLFCSLSCFQIRLPVDISSNSSIREANCCVEESISRHKPRGRSCATPPGRMKLACILAPETLS